MSEYDSNYAEEVCKEPESEMNLVIPKQRLDMNSGKILCEAQKGSLNVITNQENQNSVMSVMKNANCLLGKYNFAFVDF